MKSIEPLLSTHLRNIMIRSSGRPLASPPDYTVHSCDICLSDPQSSLRRYSLGALPGRTVRDGRMKEVEQHRTMMRAAWDEQADRLASTQ